MAPGVWRLITPGFLGYCEIFGSGEPGIRVVFIAVDDVLILRWMKIVCGRGDILWGL